MVVGFECGFTHETLTIKGGFNFVTLYKKNPLKNHRSSRSPSPLSANRQFSKNKLRSNHLVVGGQFFLTACDDRISLRKACPSCNHRWHAFRFSLERVYVSKPIHKNGCIHGTGIKKKLDEILSLTDC